MTETVFEYRTVVLCPDGPLLLRGDHEVTDPDGRVHRTTRPVSAVCRCSKSAIQPWCDGTHKLGPRSDTGSSGAPAR